MTTNSPMQERRIYDNSVVSTAQSVHKNARAAVYDRGVYVDGDGRTRSFPVHAVEQIEIELGDGAPTGRAATVTWDDSFATHEQWYDNVQLLPDGWIRVVHVFNRKDNGGFITDRPPWTFQRIAWGEHDGDTPDHE